MAVMSPSSSQLALAVSPKVQNTMEDSCTSSAKYCRNIVPAVNSDPIATPTRIMTSGLVPLIFEKPRMTIVTSMAKTNAATVVT